MFWCYAGKGPAGIGNGSPVWVGRLTKEDIVTVVGYGLCVIGAAMGIGLASFGSTTSMARQPEVAGRLFTVFILSAAFIEALCLIGFVVALIA